MVEVLGDRQEWNGANSIAASATETVYFPVGRPTEIVTTGRVLGIFRKIYLKEVIAVSVDTAARLDEIGYYTTSGQQIPLLVVDNGGVYGVPAHAYGGLHHYDLHNIIEDLECIYAIWTNSDGANAKTVWTGIRYVPMR